MSGPRSAFTDDEKRRAIERSREVGTRAAGAELGVSASRITRWGQALNVARNAPQPGKGRKGPVSHHPDLMDRACRIARGTSINHAAKKFGVSWRTVKRWLAQEAGTV